MKCPKMVDHICPEDEKECPLWTKLIINKGKDNECEQGKCAIAWLPVLLIELRVAIEQKMNLVVEDTKA